MNLPRVEGEVKSRAASLFRKETEKDRVCVCKREGELMLPVVTTKKMKQ